MKKKVLMVVKTYPTPSAAYGEIVCTAGIDLETGEWIRIYPFPFRIADDYSKFKKYETFEFDLQKSDARDKRPESYRLISIDTARKVSESISTKDYWRERMVHLLPTVIPNVNELKNHLYEESNDIFGRSLAMIQVMPESAIVTFEPTTREWDIKATQKLEQARMQIEQNLFSTPEQIAAFKTLQKIPYKIRLSFQDLTGEQHHLLVTDWEICILFLNECKRLGSEENALASVKHKIEQEIFGIKNDVYLILGSVFAHLKQDTLVVIGFVYPKKDPKQVLGMESLFG